MSSPNPTIMSELYLSSNDIPGGKYLPFHPASSKVCVPCQKLSALDEIVNLELGITGLENERQKLKEQMNYIHDRFFHRLPPETAAEIFKFCIPEDIMDLDLRVVPSRYVVSAPLILSAVCRRWRNIAHSTPQLWKTLPLPFQASNYNSFPNSFLVKEWINHAGQLPLSLNVYLSDNSREDSEVEIINVLNQYSDRWLHLKCKGPFSLLSQFSSDTQDLPQLRTLNLENPVSYGPFRRITNDKLKLHPLYLNALSIAHITLVALDFNCDHLTQLDMRSGSLYECIEVLRRAPLLTQCTFNLLRESNPIDHVEFPLPLDPIVQPRIQYLEITGVLYRGIFEHLLCPSLKTLVLDTMAALVPIIVNFLGGSGCFLESLKLINIKLSESDATSLCQGIPTLQHLHVGPNSFSMSPKILLLRLAEFSASNGETEPRYLPNLRSLSFDYFAFDDWIVLPNIFGTSTTNATQPTEHRRHVLQTVAISTYSHVRQVWIKSDRIYNIGEETLKRMIRLREMGVKWKLQVGRDQEDLIELASAHYGELK